MSDNPITVGEKYARATASSDLRVKETRSDADMLIAAGWLPDDLGARLFRLAMEVGAAKREHGIAHAEYDRMERVACRMERAAMDQQDPEWQAKKLREVKQYRDMAEAQALSARLMVMMHLKTLPQVKERVYEIALDRTAEDGIEWPLSVIRSVVGQVLDIHVDRTCHHCQGRGSNGGYGSPMVICRKCSGSGRRSERHVGKDADQRRFAGQLLSELDASLGRAAAGMIRSLKAGMPMTDDDRQYAEGQLSDRLSELRSSQAEID